MKHSILLLLFILFSIDNSSAQIDKLLSKKDIEKGIQYLDTIYLSDPVVVLHKKTRQVFMSEYQNIKRIKKLGLYNAEKQGLIYLFSHCFYCNFERFEDAAKLHQSIIAQEKDRGITLFKKRGLFQISKYKQEYKKFLVMGVNTKYYNKHENTLHGGWLFKKEGIHRLVFPMK